MIVATQLFLVWMNTQGSRQNEKCNIQKQLQGTAYTDNITSHTMHAKTNIMKCEKTSDLHFQRHAEAWQHNTVAPHHLPLYNEQIAINKHNINHNTTTYNPYSN